MDLSLSFPLLSTPLFCFFIMKHLDLVVEDRILHSFHDFFRFVGFQVFV
jgi:hypothetical protein